MGQNIIQVPKWPQSRRRRRQSDSSADEKDFLRARGLTLCPDCKCKIRPKRLSRHRERCPKRNARVSPAKAVGRSELLSGSVMATFQGEGIEYLLLDKGSYRTRQVVEGGDNARETPHERYARIVGEYNRECDRLADMRAEIDRLASRLRSPQTEHQLGVKRGDRVKIKDGPFEYFEGTVEEVIEARSLVKVTLVIFNRPTPVDLEYWQVEGLNGCGES